MYYFYDTVMVMVKPLEALVMVKRRPASPPSPFRASSRPTTTPFILTTPPLSDER